MADIEPPLKCRRRVESSNNNHNNHNHNGESANDFVASPLRSLIRFVRTFVSFQLKVLLRLLGAVSIITIKQDPREAIKN